MAKTICSKTKHVEFNIDQTQAFIKMQFRRLSHHVPIFGWTNTKDKVIVSVPFSSSYYELHQNQNQTLHSEEPHGSKSHAPKNLFSNAPQIDCNSQDYWLSFQTSLLHNGHYYFQESVL